MTRDIVIVLVGLALVGVVWSGWTAYHRGPTGGVACTMEAKLCPDGSYVGRSGPRCEFAACPPAPRSHKDAVFTIDGMPVSLASAGIQYFGNEAMGDLNSDGKDDTAFLVTYDGGGSGTFYYVVVALKTDDAGYAALNAVFLGDRIAPQTSRVEAGELIVNYAERKPNDPMTVSPSVGVSKYLKVEGDHLIESNHP